MKISLMLLAVALALPVSETFSRQDSTLAKEDTTQPAAPRQTVRIKPADRVPTTTTGELSGCKDQAQGLGGPARSRFMTRCLKRETVRE
jgi:hypothetical protein